MEKIIIAGGRDFDDIGLMNKTLNNLLDRLKLENNDIQIVCGGADGADAQGAAYGVSRSISVKYFLAKWNIHGKAAGPIRNRQMAEYADRLIAFWDGKSRGTDNMISEARKQNLKIKVINYG